MLNAPRNLAQLWIALIGTPGLSAVVWAIWARARLSGGDEASSWGTLAVWVVWALCALGLGCGWSVFVAGWSRFGAAHAVVSPWAMSVLWLWPASTGLMPVIWNEWTPRADAVMVGLHVVMLVTSSTWHWHRSARVAAQANRKGTQDWASFRVDMGRSRLQERGRASDAPWQSSLAAAMLSVSVYAVMRWAWDWPERLAMALVLMNLAAVYLYLGPLGRTLGDGVRLWQLQVSRGVPPFQHEVVDTLLSWRAGRRTKPWSQRQ